MAASRLILEVHLGPCKKIAQNLYLKCLAEECKGVFRGQSKICDGTFLPEQLTAYKLMHWENMPKAYKKISASFMTLEELFLPLVLQLECITAEKNE